MAKTELDILILADDKPGHYHLAEGVAAAIGRRRPVRTQQLTIARRRIAPTRLLRHVIDGRLIGPRQLLKLAYRLDTTSLPAADLVISAGGDTIIANVALARALGVPNIFCGTLRHLPPESFALVVSSYERHARLPRHLVCLKPNGIDPDRLGRPGEIFKFGPLSRPKLAALLIGGNSGLFHYEAQEWHTLLAFLPVLTAAWGTRWVISTSRRTDDTVADAVARLARDRSVVADFIDYRTAGPGTLPRLLGPADIAVCTEDSSTMLSEAVCARLPVIGVAPHVASFKPEEAEYRQLMLARNWCRSVPIARLEVESLAGALAEITPLTGNHLDLLSGEIAERLPELF